VTKALPAPTWAQHVYTCEHGYHVLPTVEVWLEVLVGSSMQRW
jgi:hypothetical protein